MRCLEVPLSGSGLWEQFLFLLRGACGGLDWEAVLGETPPTNAPRNVGRVWPAPRPLIVAVRVSSLGAKIGMCPAGGKISRSSSLERSVSVDDS